jgi:hypothetical protein
VNSRDRMSGVSDMIEYIIISGILMMLMFITVLTLTPLLIDQPADQLADYTFVDIANGVSTRIVEVYIIAPDRGNVSTKFDIPDDVVGRGYDVELITGSTGDQVIVSRENIRRKVSLAGIGETLAAQGETTGQGFNIIEYRSEGFR